MNQIISMATGRALPSEHLHNADPEALIQEMANQLYAGILGGLNTSSDQDVIQYLYNAPQRYHYRLILNHYDRALLEAKQMMVAAEMSKPGAA